MPLIQLPNGRMTDEIRMPLYDEVSIQKDNMNLTIEKVKNGFVVSFQGEKYVFSSLYKLQTFIGQQFTKKK